MVAITKLDPTAALIIIDLQQAIAALPLITPLTVIVESANRLSDAFRGYGLPVVNVVADNVKVSRNDHGRTARSVGRAGTELLTGLLRSNGDHHVLKTHWGAFTDTDLEMFLREHGVSQLVIVGVATSVGIESTIRHAVELGFNIAVATDGVTDVSAESHNHSMQTILPRISETGATTDILKALERAQNGAEVQP